MEDIINELFEPIENETNSKTIRQLVDKYKIQQQELSKANDKLKKIDNQAKTQISIIKSQPSPNKEADDYFVARLETISKIINFEIREFKKEDKQIEKIEIDYARDIEEKIFYEESDKPNHCILGDAGTELLINKINELIDEVNKLKKESDR